MSRGFCSWRRWWLPHMPWFGASTAAAFPDSLCFPHPALLPSTGTRNNISAHQHPSRDHRIRTRTRLCLMSCQRGCRLDKRWCFWSPTVATWRCSWAFAWAQAPTQVANVSLGKKPIAPRPSPRGWTSVLNQILQPLDFSAQDVNWIGFATSMVALPSGVFFALLIDKAKGVSFRCLLFVQFTVAAACFAWISLAASGVLPHERNAIIAASMLIGICITGCNALAYEAAIEVVYPVGEVMSSTILSGALSFSISVFPLLRFALSGNSLNALNWVATGCCGACVLLMLLYKEQRRRFSIDSGLSDGSEHQHKHQRQAWVVSGVNDPRGAGLYPDPDLS
eukprot:m.231258 g.231258  ORF g.231258 m.231258 type:complete len:337 (-) comp18869_c0_seq10:118-1128(-)